MAAKEFVFTVQAKDKDNLKIVNYGNTSCRTAGKYEMLRRLSGLNEAVQGAKLYCSVIVGGRM